MLCKVHIAVFHNDATFTPWRVWRNRFRCKVTCKLVAARVLDTLRLRDWTPDAHYVGPVQTRGAYGAVTPTSARESGDGLASRERAREAAAFSRVSDSWAWTAAETAAALWA